MMAAHALVIAGGGGHRLGGVYKARIRINGVESLARVAAALQPKTDLRLVSTGPAGQVLGALPDGWTGISDLPDCGVGPLAAVVAAVAHLRETGIIEGVLLTAAVDTPFLPARFGEKMLVGLADNQAAFAAWRDDFYPPNAAWQLSALQNLPERTNLSSLKALQQELRAVAVTWPAEAPNPFANFNTLADLIALQRRAMDGQKGVET